MLLLYYPLYGTPKQPVGPGPISLMCFLPLKPPNAYSLTLGNDSETAGPACRDALD